MADSLKGPSKLSRSLNVSSLASKFQQAEAAVHVIFIHLDLLVFNWYNQGRQGKGAPVERTESRASRFQGARAKFQAEAKETRCSVTTTTTSVSRVKSLADRYQQPNSIRSMGVLFLCFFCVAMTE